MKLTRVILLRVSFIAKKFKVVGGAILLSVSCFCFAAASGQLDLQLNFDDQTHALFKVEVADNPQSITTGLMHRTQLPAKGGMLFIFPQTHVAKFWMKDTHIPLDIIFFDKQQRVVSTKRSAIPESLDIISSKQESSFALEILAGEIGNRNPISFILFQP